MGDSAATMVDVEAPGGAEDLAGRERAHEPAVSPGHGRLAELDALRGLAALSVMMFHYTWQEQAHGAVGPLLWGRYGVQLFFMISGYVILMTVRRVGSAREFAVGRVARLYPAFWVACGLTYTAVALWDPKWRVEPWEAWANLLMVQIRGMRPIDGVYWTLHQEMFFYLIMFGLLWAGGLGALRRRGLQPARYAQMVMAALVLTSICGLRFSAWFSLFLIGMVLFDSRDGWRWRHTVFMGIAAADIVVRSQREAWADHDELAGWGYVAVVAACAGVVLLATRVRMAWLTNPVVLFLGAVSYPVYLLHARIGYIIIRALRAEGMETNAAIGVAALCIVGAAAAVTFGVERPVGRWVRGVLSPKC